jgi:Holliday junction resolvase
MSGKAPRQKGNRFEREIVATLCGAGLDAFRIPLSGSMRGFKSDCVIRLAERELTIEAKSRARGFAFIYKAIEDADILCIKADRAEALAVMPLAELAALLSQLEAFKSQQPTSEPLKANSQRDTSIINLKPSEALPL